METQVNPRRIPLWRVLLSVLLPVGLMLFQAAFWDIFKPYAWFLAYPAIMIAPLIGGTAGGISATIATACMVYYIFLPPSFTFKLDFPYTFYIPLVLFVGTSIGVNLITRRMRMLEMNAALRESETRFETLFEQAPIALCHVDQHGKFLRINNYMESVSGYRLEEIPDSLTWFEKAYPDPEYRNHVITTWKTAQDAAENAGTRVEPQEYDIVTKSGEVKTMLFSATPLGRELLSFMVDITPIRKARESLAQYSQQLEKQVEERIRELELSRQEVSRREHEYRILAENASDVVCRYTAEGYLDWASPSLTTLLGWTPAELHGKYFLELVHPDDRESATAQYPKALSGDTVNFEVRLRAKSGEYRHVSVMAKLAGDGIHDKSIVTGLRDIHAEVVARNTLNEKSKILDLAVQAADVGI
jgi:PAS domain S-box-containing protein